jgi:hypothetical protein
MHLSSPTRPLLPLLCLLPLAASAIAQTVVLAPSMAATMDGSSNNLSIFWGSAAAPRGHTQILLSTADLSVNSGTIDALAFRPVSSFGASSAYTTSLHIEMSMSNTSYEATQPTFASNRGANPVVVFDGIVTIPAIAASNIVPPPPLPPIQFTTPFVYDASQGTSLVLEISSQAISPIVTYQIGQVGIGGGSQQSIFATGACQTTQGTISGTLGYNGLQPYPGGPFVIGYNGYPTNRASFAMSVLMFDFSLAGTFSGFQLPVPLVSLGLPANAPCRLAIVPELVTPITYVPGSNGGGSGHLEYTTTFPAISGLAGVQFGTQALSLDIDNSLPSPLLFPSLATKWTIGTGDHPAAAMVVRMADSIPPSPTGGVQVYQAPVVHLHFQ